MSPLRIQPEYREISPEDYNKHRFIVDTLNDAAYLVMTPDQIEIYENYIQEQHDMYKEAYGIDT